MKCAVEAIRVRLFQPSRARMSELCAYGTFSLAGLLARSRREFPQTTTTQEPTVAHILVVSVVLSVTILLLLIVVVVISLVVVVTLIIVVCTGSRWGTQGAGGEGGGGTRRRREGLNQQQRAVCAGGAGVQPMGTTRCNTRAEASKAGPGSDQAGLETRPILFGAAYRYSDRCVVAQDRRACHRTRGHLWV